jgi:hypothetical protein
VDLAIVVQYPVSAGQTSFASLKLAAVDFPAADRMTDLLSKAANQLPSGEDRVEEVLKELVHLRVNQSGIDALIEGAKALARHWGVLKNLLLDQVEVGRSAEFQKWVVTIS